MDPVMVVVMLFGTSWRGGYSLGIKANESLSEVTTRKQ